MFLLKMSTEELRGDIYYKLKSLIEALTHSGLKTLDDNLFKEVKKICRSSTAATKETYSLIYYQLNKNHSEIRHLAFQMCVELFKRSALFRELVVQDLQSIFELTADTNPKKRVPPPKNAATILERLALSTIKKWNDEYGEIFKELKVAFSYLKHSKKVNFDIMNVNNEIELERQQRETVISEERMKTLIEEINSNEAEINSTVTEFNNCLSLLVPSLNDFNINDQSPGCSYTGLSSGVNVSDDDSNAINLKHFGIMPNYSITINLSVDKIEIKKTDENSSLIQNIEDNVKLIQNRFVPLIKKWNRISVKCSNSNGTTIQRILKLKEAVDDCLRKFSELNIQKVTCDSESDDSDDFEEVTKEHYEASAPEIEKFEIVPLAAPQRKEEVQWKISIGEDGDPASAVSTLKSLQKQDNQRIHCRQSTEIKVLPCSSQQPPKKSRKDKLLESAPKLPYDIDLYHWEDDNLKAPTLLSIKMDNPKFWGVSSVDDMDEIPNPNGVAALRTRVIEFSGKFEPVKWSCRAPLPSGKLCPRKDRYKCPFHGKIIPRDEKGVPKETNNLESSGKKRKEPDWQDLELLEDIKNATGVDLTIQNKNARRSTKKVSKTHKIMKTSSSTLLEIEKRKFPGLTDTFGKKDNAYKRISKKIFKRSALNKVASTLDKLDFVKHRDKFGEQFNYVYQT